MAMNRYGRVYHSDLQFNTLRFPSADARQEFANKFEQYHAKYDHDGEPPRFESIAAAEANRGVVHDVHEATLDGYSSNQIWEYHNNRNGDKWTHYEPPTTIAPPVIVVERLGEFIDSSTLTRHELSAIFMDMPDEDFQNLLKSVERDGFKDPIIRMIDTQVLDGWHRYRAAKELNLLRKLRFRQWNEQNEGDPAAFVMARNIERRHLSAGQRAQIVVSFNERFGMGRPSVESSPNGGLKSREELAKEAGVGTTTIDRAVKVEKSGQAEQVISGEKSASAIIEEMTIQELWKQINPAISAWKQAREGVGHASKTMFIHATLRWEGLVRDTETDVKVLKELLNLLTTTETNVLEELIRKQLDGKSLWDDEEDLEEKRKLALDAERRMFNALDEVAPDWDYDDFIAAALDKHSDWGATALPEIEVLEVPQIWEGRYDLLTREIEEPAAWIQQMLDRMAESTESESEQAEQPTQTAAEPETPEEDSPDRKAFNLALNNAQTRLSWMWDSFENMDYLTGVPRETFAVEAAKTLNCYEEGRYGSGENYLLEKDYALLKNLTISELKAWTKRFDKIQDAIHKKSDWITSLVPAEADNAPDPDMSALWDAFNKRYPKWKAKYAESGFKENELIQAATEAELFDALRVYRDSDRTGPVTAEEIRDVTDLMKKRSYPFARRVRDVLREKGAHVGSLEIERSYAQNQLRVVQNAISPLLERLGADKMSPDLKEVLTADLYDVFLQYESVPTEKEMIIALLDVVDGILSEEIADGRFDTLDNEVLCPDDEADRQAMNSDLVTSAE